MKSTKWNGVACSAVLFDPVTNTWINERRTIVVIKAHRNAMEEVFRVLVQFELAGVKRIALRSIEVSLLK